MVSDLILKVVAATVRALDWALPKNLHLRIAIGILTIWVLSVGFFFLNARFGSITSPSGYARNGAYHDVAAAVVDGTLFTLMICVFTGVYAAWMLDRRNGK